MKIYKVIEFIGKDVVLRMTTEDRELAYSYYAYTQAHYRNTIIKEEDK